MHMNNAAAYIVHLHVGVCGVARGAIDSCEAMCAFPLADSEQPHHQGTFEVGGWRGGGVTKYNTARTGRHRLPGGPNHFFLSVFAA